MPSANETLEFKYLEISISAWRWTTSSGSLNINMGGSTASEFLCSGKIARRSALTKDDLNLSDFASYQGDTNRFDAITQQRRKGNLPNPGCALVWRSKSTFAKKPTRTKLSGMSNSLSAKSNQITLSSEHAWTVCPGMHWWIYQKIFSWWNKEQGTSSEMFSYEIERKKAQMLNEQTLSWTAR